MSQLPPDDDERTVVKPNPGGRARARRTNPGGLGAINFDFGLLTDAGLNPVVGAASPILNLVRRLRGGAAGHDPAGLRARIVDQLQTFERRLTAAEVPQAQAQAAHLALCAALDDAVRHAPSGAAWSGREFTALFHPDAADDFFDLLERLRADPAAHRDVLALMYFLLSLGFEGRFHAVPDGGITLRRVREELFAALRPLYGPSGQDLSPHWHGVQARDRPLRSTVAAWTILSVAAATLAVSYLGFTWALASASDATLHRLAAAPPSRRGATLAVSNPLPPPPLPPGLRQGLAAQLRPVIIQGLVNIDTRGTTLVVHIHNAGMFASGSATVTDRFAPVLTDIAIALAGQGGTIRVIGHTDNQPSRSPRFPSNWDLSRARAQAVADILATRGLRDRLAVEGRGDTDPIASNEAPDGRERNNRTDLVIETEQVESAGPAAGGTDR